MLEYLWNHKEYIIFWTVVWAVSFAAFSGVMYLSVRSITSAIREANK